MWIALLFAVACDRIPDASPVPTHIVARGETLGVIASRYGVTVEDLVRWNELASPDRIEVGQALVVWSNAVTPPAAPRKKARKRAGATIAANAPAPANALSLPSAQPCLPPPDVVGDEGMAASAGLSEIAVSSAMSAFVGNTLRCVPAGWEQDGTLVVTVNVACTGLVASVNVIDPGAFPLDMVACVADVLRYASFPTHDQRDGFAFDFPLRFAFGAP